MEVLLSLIELAVLIVMICIVFSLPSRFREQKEHNDKRMDVIETKLDKLLADEKALNGSSKDNQESKKER